MCVVYQCMCSFICKCLLKLEERETYWKCGITESGDLPDMATKTEPKYSAKEFNVLLTIEGALQHPRLHHLIKVTEGQKYVDFIVSPTSQSRHRSVFYKFSEKACLKQRKKKMHGRYHLRKKNPDESYWLPCEPTLSKTPTLT